MTGAVTPGGAAGLAPAWASYLSSTAGADAPSAPAPALSAAEAERLARYRDRLLQAWESRDRAALRAAKQAVLEAAAARSGPEAAPPLRGALRLLAWRMAALRPQRAPVEWG
ncbi:hypothetical protein [Paracidovorax anthurii]|uniref:Uncharacterized protein n=1 Tax=Paracidovorax anthurii TaxID=78229 RepID=A0A328ZJV0_9BURK|nr:hypothetical protein [Paracidovorax anthurii]RAR86438.1 hypothetical protein AX018_100124 [Paracidovorax anthurii]